MAQNSIALAKVKTLQANATVSAATAASPIAITTSAVHGLETGDIVQISGVTGNTAANGQFVVTVTSTTAFTLNASAGNAAYVSGGTVAHVGFAATVLADNTVYTSTSPDFTLKFRIEKLSAGSSLRASFEDTTDAAFVTGQPGPFFNRQGLIDISADANFSAKREDWPDARLGSAGNSLRVSVFLTGGAGANTQFSAWIE